MSFTYAYPHPAVTTDVVLFSIVEHELVVLLIRRGAEPYKGCWALPGGFLDIDGDLEACARRELAEETGLPPLSWTVSSLKLSCSGQCSSFRN